MAVSTSRTLQAGGTIWGLVAKANPNATDARIAKMTNAVLKDNDMTSTEARSLRAGSKIDLSEALPAPKPAAPAKPATPATPAAPAAQSPMTVYVPSNLFNMTPDQYTQLQQSMGQQSSLLQALQQQMAQTNMPAMPTSGSSGGLDAFLKGQIKNSGSSQQLASSAGQLSFGLSGQQFLPFANPSVILGNLGIKA